MPHHDAKGSVPLSTDRYQHALTDSKCAVVYTNRPVPAWYTELTRAIGTSSVQPLQLWLVNESIDSLETRLAEALSTYGVSKPVSAAVAKDVEMLVQLFVELSEDERPFVSFRTIDNEYFKNQPTSVSKDWHVDTSVLTLSCGYAGRGTEWIWESEKTNLHDAFIKEKMPGKAAIGNSVPPSNIHEMQPFEVSVLKGEIRAAEDARSQEFLNHFLKEEEKEPFNEGGGLVHRGPGYAHGDVRRLLLTVSTMRIPSWLRKRTAT